MPADPMKMPRKARLWLAAAAIAAVAVMATVLVWNSRPQNEKAGLIARLSAYQAPIRTVGREEYDFFSDFVRQNRSAPTEAAALEQFAKDYINAVNAKFALGSSLGLCENYDYSAMLFRMEQENTIRQAKSANGEAVYGPVRFTPRSYFDYLESNLETDLVNYLVEHADSTMEAEAKAYYDASPALFEQLVSITYELEENGVSRLETLTSEDMRTLERADSPLAEFLYAAQPNETLEYQSPEGLPCRATLIEVLYEIPSYDDAASVVMRSWLNAQVMDSLYASVAQRAPAVFALDS